MTRKEKELRKFNKKFGEELIAFNKMDLDASEEETVMQAAKLNEMIQVAWIRGYDLNDEMISKLEEQTYEYVSTYIKTKTGATYRSHVLNEYKNLLNKKMYYIVNQNEVLLAQCKGIFSLARQCIDVMYGILLTKSGFGCFSSGFETKSFKVIHGIDALCDRYGLEFKKTVDLLASDYKRIVFGVDHC